MVINSIAQFNKHSVIKDLAYGKEKLNQLDIYIPEYVQNSNISLPVVIFFYGGCWGECSTYSKDDYRFVAQDLTSNQYITVIADYRRYPEVLFPEIIEDCKNVVEWVNNNISGYHGDPSQVFLMGHSAGAHLAAMLVLNEKYLEPKTYQGIKGFIGLAGPYDFLPLTEAYQEQLFGPVENYPASQPINFVDGSKPPMLLLHGKLDKKVLPRNAINLHAKIKQSSGCAQLRLYNATNHTDLIAAFALSFRKYKPILADIFDFLEYYSETNTHCKGFTL